MRFGKLRPVHLNRLAAVARCHEPSRGLQCRGVAVCPCGQPACGVTVRVASPSGPAASPAASADDLNALLPEEIRTKGVIKVLTDPSFNPISFYKEGSTTEIIGSDPDILRAMGEKLGVTIEFEPTAFPGMLPGVESGRGDLAGGGLDRLRGTREGRDVRRRLPARHALRRQEGQHGRDLVGSTECLRQEDRVHHGRPVGDPGRRPQGCVRRSRAARARAGRGLRHQRHPARRPLRARRRELLRRLRLRQRERGRER